MNTHKWIPVFAINLKSRTDRFLNIKSEFRRYNFFKLEVVKAIEDANGGYGLWKTIYAIIAEADRRGDDYVLICEDDHIFTSHFNIKDLMNNIAKGKLLGIDVLLGGVSWSRGILRSTDNLYWIDNFNGTQFMIIYRVFFKKFLEMPIRKDLTVDMAISNATNHIMVIYPFISIQREFGYSDATDQNNEIGYVDALFNATMNKFDQLHKVFKVLRSRIHSEDEAVL
ncbi:hypothetical protein ACFE6N_20645 [Pedobacter sp. BG31]|uniref:hypothetical protein n=1 Tax=Pedobacter sp. BG31 TaxID=3349697 RepID=UPI0035F3C19B